MPFSGSGFAGNFISGFQGDAAQQREHNQREAERQQQREDSVFSALANSEDPDVRAAAVTGLLTGNHPAGYLNKFFGKMQEHPAYAQIKQLVSTGHQPFLSGSEQREKDTAGQVSGGITGAVSGLTKTGEAQPGDKRRVAMARAGAALPGNKPLQHGTIYHADGTSELGSYDPNGGNYYNADGAFVDDAVRFSASGAVASAGSTSAGGTWAQMTGADFKRQFPNMNAGSVKDDDYVRVRVGANGQPVGSPVISQGPSSNLSHYSFFPTATGIGSGITSGKGAGTVTETAAGGAGVQHAEPPATEAAQYRADVDQILRIHPVPKAVGFFKVTPAQQKAWQDAVDQEAKTRGYASWADLQARAGGASRATGAATPPPPSAPSVAPPAGPQGAAGPPGASAPNAPKKGDRVGSGPAPTAAVPDVGNPLDPFGILH
jgi:hypothetical protein